MYDEEREGVEYEKTIYNVSERNPRFNPIVDVKSKKKKNRAYETMLSREQP
jgi:hypothetical protein